jgi:hypothetical protein
LSSDEASDGREGEDWNMMTRGHIVRVVVCNDIVEWGAVRCTMVQRCSPDIDSTRCSRGQVGHRSLGRHVSVPCNFLDMKMFEIL